MKIKWTIPLFLGVLGSCAASDHELLEFEAVAAPSAAALQSKKIDRLIVLGDSISEGMGAARLEWGYAALLYRNDDALYPEEAGRDLSHAQGPLHYISVAHMGDETHDLRTTQLPRLDHILGAAPVRGRSIVVLTIGGNDLKNQVRPGAKFSDEVARAALGNLHEVIAYFRNPQRFPDGVSIYLGNIYDLTDGEDTAHGCLEGLVLPGAAESIARWNDAYAAFAEAEGITLVDIHSAFLGHGFNYRNANNPAYHRRDPTLWLSPRDCIHPNNRGHHHLRQLFWQAISSDR